MASSSSFLLINFVDDEISLNLIPSASATSPLGLLLGPWFEFIELFLFKEQHFFNFMLYLTLLDADQFRIRVH